MDILNKKDSKIHELVIEENYLNQRIDNFLLNIMKNVPRKHIYKILRVGTVRVNKKRVKPLYRLQTKDIVRIPPFWNNTKICSTNIPINIANLLLNSVIYEDERMLVINKPIGIASHGGSGINFGVIEMLRELRNDLKTLDLVHRLDKETSGCLILSKKKSVLRELHKLLFEGKIIKRYVLLVHGKWNISNNIVNLPLLKLNLKSGERIVIVDKQGKESLTLFNTIKIFDNYSLLNAELKTGRTHQIRVHAAAMGFPIVGDDKYGGKNIKMGSADSYKLHRLFLHAQMIKFYMSCGNKFEFNSASNWEYEIEHFCKN